MSHELAFPVQRIRYKGSGTEDQVQRIKFRSLRSGGSVQGLSPARPNRAHFRQTEDVTESSTARFRRLRIRQTRICKCRSNKHSSTICWESRAVASLPTGSAGLRISTVPRKGEVPHASFWFLIGLVFCGHCRQLRSIWFYTIWFCQTFARSQPRQYRQEHRSLRGFLSIRLRELDQEF